MASCQDAVCTDCSLTTAHLNHPEQLLPCLQDMGNLSLQRLFMARDHLTLTPQLINSIGGLQALSVHSNMLPYEFRHISRLQGQLTCLILKGRQPACVQGCLCLGQQLSSMGNAACCSDL